MEIQLVLNGEESGPHSLEEVQTLLANGDATLKTMHGLMAVQTGSPLLRSRHIR